MIFACFLSCKAQKTESKVEKFDTSEFEHPELISDFTSAEWEKVFKAKDSLLNIGETVIPDLLKLMDNPKAFEKLQNTAGQKAAGLKTLHWHNQPRQLLILQIL